MNYCFAWWKGPLFQMLPEIGNSSTTLLQLNPEFKCLTDTIGSGCEVYLACSVSVHGTLYKPVMTVLVDFNEDKMPSFGHIDKMFDIFRCYLFCFAYVVCL